MIIGAVFLLIAALGIGAYFYLLVPVTFENRLVLPVKVVWAGRELPPVAPGASFTRKVRRGDSFPIQWYAALPTGAPLGEAISGSTTMDHVAGGATISASAEGASTPMFAPLITNQTGVVLHVTVNPGTAAAAECACSIPVGATRLAHETSAWRRFADGVASTLAAGAALPAAGEGA